MAEETIKVEMGQDDIDEKTDSEKLSLLVKIAFANHATLKEHGKLLFGNGQQGLCDIARMNRSAIRAIWGLMILIIGGFITLALK